MAFKILNLSVAKIICSKCMKTAAIRHSIWFSRLNDHYDSNHRLCCVHLGTGVTPVRRFFTLCTLSVVNFWCFRVPCRDPTHAIRGVLSSLLFWPCEEDPVESCLRAPPWYSGRWLDGSTPPGRDSYPLVGLLSRHLTPTTWGINIPMKRAPKIAAPPQT